MKANEYCLCSDCQDSIEEKESIITIDNKILCYACDTKRLIKSEAEQ